MNFLEIVPIRGDPSGVGASNFAVVLDQYALTEFIGKGDFRTIVHNKYLLVWAETGILGLSAFLCFLGATIRKGWQCWRLQDGFVSMAALGLTVGILVHMLHMFVDIFNHRPNVQLIWTTAALIVCLHNIGRREYLARLQSMTNAPTQRDAVFR